ncbi:MAG: ABC transporter permease [Bdellovibrionaceae bacterium]|nr:ABC transporter permease [Pseudobdellovibrionaceae bacterium]
MNVYFLIAYRNILQRRVRSLMLAAAIVAVSVIFSLLLALLQGVQDTMVGNGTALMTGHVNIAGFYKISQSSANPQVTKYPPLLEYAKEKIPEAAVIVDRVKAYGKVISEVDSTMIPMWGVNMDQEANVLGRLELEASAESNSPGDLKKLGESGTIALFAVHAKKLKVGVGDMVTVSVPTYRNMNNTKDVKVVAILKDVGMMSQFNAYLNANDVRALYQSKPDSTGQIMIYLKKLADVPAVEARIRKDLSDKGYVLMDKDANPFWMKFDRVAGESWTGQKLDITTWEDETSFLKWVVSLLSVLTFILTIVLSIIIVMGLINALWMSVKERTTEIGTLRAIGMQKSKVLWMFMLESLILSISSTAAGLILVGIMSQALNAAAIPIESDAFKMFLMTNNLSFHFGVAPALTTFFSLVTFFTLGSLIPAFQAAKLSPIVAINQS